VKTCDRCGYIELPYDGEVFSCDCKSVMNSVDNILREIEDNFESLWEGVAE